MIQSLLVRGAALAALLAASAIHAADSSVPYVPTPQKVVDRMLEVAKVGPQDYLIDLGSGDGRIVVTAAAKHGARGFGDAPVARAEIDEIVLRRHFPDLEHAVDDRLRRGHVGDAGVGGVQRACGEQRDERSATNE